MVVSTDQGSGCNLPSAKIKSTYSCHHASRAATTQRPTPERTHHNSARAKLVGVGSRGKHVNHFIIAADAHNKHVCLGRRRNEVSRDALRLGLAEHTADVVATLRDGSLVNEVRCHLGRCWDLI